jgi:hypothetical protein
MQQTRNHRASYQSWSVRAADAGHYPALVRVKLMISEILLPALHERFGERGMQPGRSSNEVAIFPAVHPEVGDVTIWDDGYEATVEIGDITHGHFNPYDDSLSSEQVPKRVSDDVVEFLQDMFEDKVLLWKARDGRSGGWCMLEQNDSLMEGDVLTYLWSGPIQRPDLDHAG